VADDTYLVVKVLDGDTVELAGGEKLRYIGIDTPEKSDPFYQEAKDFNRKLVEGKRLKIEFDVQKKDKYGRLLGYVYVSDTFVNAELLRAGLAVLYTYPPNVKYVDYFIELQKEARQHKKGLWSQIKDREEFYLAVKGSKRFHRPDCSSIEETQPQKLLKFKSRDEALDQGFSACRRCKP
jgi:micrococcal nuclease